MPRSPDATGHLVAALVVWLAYAALLITQATRGLTGKRLSLLAIALFLLSLGVFAFV
jgi:hypothetical protein